HRQGPGRAACRRGGGPVLSVLPAARRHDRVDRRGVHLAAWQWRDVGDVLRGDGARGHRLVRVAPAPLPPDRGSLSMATISLDAVSRWYGNVVAVNGITMTVGPGVTGLLGPNGAGKSTLIALMSGFLSPSAGSVTLDGTPIWRNT